jgi:hypothetical protein
VEKIVEGIRKRNGMDFPVILTGGNKPDATIFFSQVHLVVGVCTLLHW